MKIFKGNSKDIVSQFSPLLFSVEKIRRSEKLQTDEDISGTKNFPDQRGKRDIEEEGEDRKNKKPIVTP